ncbi:two-component regulator propeller domain-containing protein [uncultured Bacteroides sp.]|uniref:two-component regulator propeller domain-containing protein n=1 Tax=uncultured Bacteroides sp. TaxID=162156 RepID=UPI002AA7ED80|nr:two-component regulator propeller domain-containing protein [uncultured Bacteroides sp.]
MRKSLITLLFLAILAPKAFASIEIRSKQITIADGLANNSVRYFLQDSKGFMWLGTLNGLSRYDGSSFISFYPSPDKTLSLQDGRVYDMEEDKKGFLWINFSSEQYSCYDLKKACFVDYTGCGEFQQKYSKKIIAENGDVWLWHDGNGCRKITYNKEFRSITYKAANGKIPSDNVNFVAEGERGTIWVGSGSGLTKISGNTSTIIDRKKNFFSLIHFKGQTYFLTKDNRVFVYDHATAKLRNINTSVAAGSLVTDCFLLKDKWIILTSTGVYTYDFKQKRLIQAPDFFGENIKSGNVLSDNKKDFWIYNHSGKVWYINAHTARQKQFQLIPPEKMGYVDFERYHVIHDSRNIIWISTYGNGLFAYDIAKDELSHFVTSMNGLSHIGSDYLLNVTEDRSGEVWVSSEFSGISRISVINAGAYRFFPEDESLLDRSNTIRMISHLHEGEIWMGTRKGGLYVYDQQLKLKYAKKDFHSNIYAVKKDKDGKMWMGSRGDGLCIDGIWYRHSDSDPHSLANNNIFCIYRDKKDRMWVGTFGGGLDLAIKTKNGYQFQHYLDKLYGQRQVRVICEDNNGMMWVGTSDGVYVFHPDTITANPNKYYLYNYSNGKLRSNEVRCLLSDNKGRIWIGTSGAGFSICTPRHNYGSLTFEHYTMHDGLSNDMVQSIAEDRHGHIWFATEYGVSKFILEKKTFENYFFSAYPQGNVYTENSGCVCDNGNILFGSNYGLLVFNPDIVKKDSLSFPVVFTNLNVNGINVLPNDANSPLLLAMPYSDRIHLKSNQNSFVIDFSSFNYADAGQTKYSYRLLDYDKDWSAPSSLNFAAYKMLPYGNYKLQVKVCNSSGIWNKEIATLQIMISPPFYLSVWAFLIYALLIAGGGYFAFNVARNFNRLHNKIEIEKQLTEYKLVFFTNISHEFRTPLTLIQGALDRIQRLNITSQDLVHPLKTMEKSTQRMLKLIDQLLEFRKMQNNKLALSLEETDVVAMLYEIFLSFGDIAESKNMDFLFVPSVGKYKMYIDKGKLDKIVYNILSNAFKYTPQGGQIRLMVNADTEKSTLAISVSDTGVGIPKEKRNELFNRFMQSNFSGDSVGIGLHLTHELVLVHKGTIFYEENPGGGSVFTVNLPLDTKVYEEKDFLIRNNVLMNEHPEMVVSENSDEPLASLTDSIIPLNQQKILVIEDDNDVRQYLKEELGAYFEVLTADNGSTGFDMAGSSEPSLIVCDVLMPGMNGFEVTKKLKSDFDTSHIPVILLTALSLPENHLEGIESGADAYLSKPFSIKLLLARIIKLLEQREKLRVKFSEEPGITRSAIYASERDKEFVDELHRILEENISNANFSVDEFASIMNIGRTIFYKKVKGVTGYSPNEYIRILRMKKAAELLLLGKLTVSEISYKVGIDDPFYFSKCFKSQFGVAPSIYQKGK